LSLDRSVKSTKIRTWKKMDGGNLTFVNKKSRLTDQADT